MAKTNHIEELNKRVDLVFESIGDLQKSLETRKAEAPPKSVIRQHFDTIVTNALKAPHSTFSGLAVGACYVGAKVFPQYSPVLADLQNTFTALTGVTAGSATLKPSPKAVNNTTQTPNFEEYG
jgi:hypothetical protein